MLKRSFVGRQEPAVALLYTPGSLAEAAAVARSAEADGADGIAVEISDLSLEERTTDGFRGVMNAVCLPFMFIDYRKDKFCGADDDARQRYLLTAAEAGADVIDVIGDLYAPAPRELTMDPAAVKRQKSLIRKIHAKGAHVLISSHMPKEALKAEEVLDHLLIQRDRGADILKIVVRCDSDEEFVESVRTMLLLRRELDKPFIYLAGGRFGRAVRYLGPKLGVAVEFAVHDYDARGGYPQPTIRSFRQVLDNFCWDAENSR